MRLFNNFLRLFKKDNGAHFTYNLGVGFMRISAVLIAAAGILALFAAVRPGDTPEFYGTVKASVYDTDCVRHSSSYRSRRGRTRHRVYYTYTVKFKGTYSNGEEFVHKQYADKELYRIYSAQIGGAPTAMNMYVSEDGNYYITSKTGKEAAKEYRRVNSSISANLSLLIAGYTLAAAAVSACIGLGQIRLSMKYPRTDVPLTDTQLAEQKQTDDLMEEFERAYAKRQARLKAGLPPDDGSKALTDGGHTERIE